MRAFVVYESMYGNTEQLAEAIGSALSAAGAVTVVDVASAPRGLPAGVDLLVVGGPTHAFSMSRPSTRRQAAMSGARTSDVEFGIREWLGELAVGSPAPAVATFDTRVKTPRLPGSAAKAAARLARRLRLDVRDRESFFVGDQDGPLLDGELDRATDWARGLVRDLDD